MRREQEWALPEGSLYYIRLDEAHADAVGAQEGAQAMDGICITGFAGLAGEVVVPAQIGGLDVRVIDKKAFLSKKQLRKVTLPDTVEVVGDWAFAYCSSLHTVVFAETAGERSLIFGKSVFLDCDSLRFLYLRQPESATAALLAAAVTTAQAPYLLDAHEVGKEEWYRRWDARLEALLHAPDDEGYSKQVLCGEEDYGSTDLAAYESAQRKRKVRLLLLRCLYPAGVRPAFRAEMEAYLRAHTAGSPQDETWQVVCREHGEERAYYELFAALGCVTQENLDELLADAGNAYPELAAYLIRYKEEQLGHDDFFAGLSL